jgi:hypothetical protein
MGRGRVKTGGIRAEGEAKLGERATEGGEGLELGEVGPEGSSKPRALDGAGVTEEKESEEPVALADAETGKRLTLLDDVEGTKKLEGELG